MGYPGEIVFHLSADPEKRKRQREVARKILKAQMDACDELVGKKKNLENMAVTIDEYTRIPDKWRVNVDVTVESTKEKMYFIDNGEDMLSPTYACGLISFRNAMDTFCDRIQEAGLRELGELKKKSD